MKWWGMESRGNSGTGKASAKRCEKICKPEGGDGVGKHSPVCPQGSEIL